MKSVAAAAALGYNISVSIKWYYHVMSQCDITMLCIYDNMYVITQPRCVTKRNVYT